MKKKEILSMVHDSMAELEIIEQKIGMPIFEDIGLSCSRALEDIRSHISIVHGDLDEIVDAI